jgi:hypothetical protein
MSSECTEVRTKLKVRDPTSANGEYVYWADLKETLRSTGFDDLNLNLWFSDGTQGESANAGMDHSYLSGGVSYSHMMTNTNDNGQTLKELFTDANGDTAFEFKLHSIVPGSATQGPAMANDANPATAAFKVILIPEDLVAACSGNTLAFGDVIDEASGAVRDEPLVY